MYGNLLYVMKKNKTFHQSLGSNFHDINAVASSDNDVVFTNANNGEQC